MLPVYRSLSLFLSCRLVVLSPAKAFYRGLLPLHLIFGLGNPGPQYQLSRHNIGCLVVDELARRCGVRMTRRKNQSVFAGAKIADRKVWLIKPQTYMNLSGRCVGAWLGELGLGCQDILVICDDLDGDWGRLRFREMGGDGGHRGLRSIIETLGTREFLRLKIGTGRPPQGIDSSDYVLTPFLDEELKALDDLIQRAADSVEALFTHGLTYAMNQFHRIKI